MQLPIRKKLDKTKLNDCSVWLNWLFFFCWIHLVSLTKMFLYTIVYFFDFNYLLSIVKIAKRGLRRSYGFSSQTWKRSFLFWKYCLSIHANYLDNNSIKAYHAYAYQTYEVHNKQYACYCFQCRIFKLLLEVAVGRQKDSRFFLCIEDHAKICFVRTSRYVVEKEYIGFKKCKHVEKWTLILIFYWVY